jgi:hypothetical protein
MPDLELYEIVIFKLIQNKQILIVQSELNRLQMRFAIGRLRKKKTPWSESASELYRPSDRRLSAK